MSLNLQDPLLRLTGIHPRQTGGPLLARFLLTAQEGERLAYSSPGPARAILSVVVALPGTKCQLNLIPHIRKSVSRQNI